MGEDNNNSDTITSPNFDVPFETSTTRYSNEIREERDAEGASYVSPEDIDADIADIDAEVQAGSPRREELLDEKMELENKKAAEEAKATDTEHHKAPDANASDDDDDSPDQAVEPLLTASAVVAPMMGLSPAAAAASLAIGRSFIQSLKAAFNENDVNRTSTAQVAGGQQQGIFSTAIDTASLEFGKTKQNKIDIPPPSMAMKDTKETAEAVNREKLVEDMKFTVTTTDPLRDTPATRKNLEDGVKNLTERDAKLASNNTREATAETLRNSPNPDLKLAREVENNGNALSGKPTLAIADVSAELSGKFASPNVGQAQPGRGAGMVRGGMPT